MIFTIRQVTNATVGYWLLVEKQNGIPHRLIIKCNTKYNNSYIFFYTDFSCHFGCILFQKFSIVIVLHIMFKNFILTLILY